MAWRKQGSSLLLLVAVTGCPGDDGGGGSTGDSGTGEASSTGPGPATTPMTTTAVDGTADGTSSGGGETTTGEETTGGMASGQARFVVAERVGDANDTRLSLLSYAAGEVAPLQPLTDDLPMEATVNGTAVVEDGRTLLYCTNTLGDPARPCYAIDLGTDPPPAAAEIGVAPVPAGAFVTLPDYNAPSSALLFAAFVPGDTQAGIYRAPRSAGVLQSPQEIVIAGPGETLASSFTIAPDGSAVGIVRTPDGGPPQAWIAPANPPDPLAAVQVSDLVDPLLRVGAPQFVPGHDAVLYVVDDDDPTNPLALSIWYVDTSAPAPGAPVRVDDPLAAPLRICSPRVAADGHALVYYLGADGEIAGDVRFVDLSTGTPQPPVDLTTVASGTAIINGYGWSPDGRWVAYEAAQGTPDDTGLYLVDASGTAPGDPSLVSEGLIAGGVVIAWRFDDDSHWLYLAGQIGGEPPGLFRVDVSGDTPGTLQTIFAGRSWVDEELIVSHDGTHLLHAAFSGSPSVRELGLVDVSGDTPGRSMILNAPLPADVDVTYGASFAWDDSVVAYRESGPTFDDPKTLQLVDLASLEVFAVEVDAQGVRPVAALP